MGNYSKASNLILREKRESEQKLAMLSEITRLVSSLLHLQDVLDAIVDLLTREFKLDACSIRLLDDGNMIGVLVTASKKKNYFHERYNDVIYIIANQIGLAIKISQLYDEIYGFSRELEKRFRKGQES